ncbi:peptidylprolyl isomerase [Candidatus Margulisiibacteriota bacterium]
MKRLLLVFFICLLAGSNLYSQNTHPIVRFETSVGDIIIELYPEKAPITCENFVSYVEEGFYDNTIFHRVIRNFVVQGGGFISGLKQRKPKDPINNEATNKLSNLRGTIAMARTNEVNSATSQFFINLSDNTFLDHRNNFPQGFGYAVFGKVIAGMDDVVERIQSVKTITIGAFSDVPKKDIVLYKASFLREVKEKSATENKKTETNEPIMQNAPPLIEGEPVF